MTLKLTERDKKILVFLAAFVIVIPVFVWGILPLADKVMETKASLDAVKADVFEMQSKIQLYDTSVAENTSLKEEKQSIGASYYPTMQSQEVDRLITGIILNNGLTSTGLEISSIESEKNIAPYYTSGLKAGNAELYTYTVSLRAQGSKESVVSLIDDITNNYQGIHVDYFTILPGTTYLIQMQLQIYMYK